MKKSKILSKRRLGSGEGKGISRPSEATGIDATFRKAKRYKGRKTGRAGRNVLISKQAKSS